MQKTNKMLLSVINRVGLYKAKTIAVFNPSSVRFNIVSIFVYNPLMPKYSSDKRRANIVRTAKVKTITTNWHPNPITAFLLEFQLLEFPLISSYASPNSPS